MSTSPNWTPRRVATLIGLLVFAVALVVVVPVIDRARQRAEMADAIGQLKSLKFALDGFANDFDGRFPNESSAEQLLPGGSYPKFSNDYFRQLFLSGETRSERIFWTARSKATGRQPDDEVTGPAGTLDPDLVLRPGECHWAYVTEQRNTSSQERPLVLDPFLPGRPTFDPDLWDGKVIIATIDGAVKAHQLTPGIDRVVDGSGNDLFALEADAWKGSEYVPEDLLVQPQPASGP